MVSLGILALNMNQERAYYTQIAKQARTENIDVYLFSPEYIDPQTEQVHGKHFSRKEQDWIDHVFDIPTYIYDRAFYNDPQKRKKVAPIVRWLKANPMIHFLGYGLPNKWEVYEKLSNHPALSFYLPETKLATTSMDIIKQLTKKRKLLLKPVNGSQGKGIIALYAKANQVEIKTHRHKKTIHKIFSKKESFIRWLDLLLEAHPYLMQPLLSLTDTDECPFDVRILLQKNESGQWVERGRGVRKGIDKGIISNLNGGGKPLPYAEWANNLSNRKRIVIQDEIETILTTLPSILENEFGRLFELGIDIGIDKKGAVWLLDINSKPGHQVIHETNPEQSDEMIHAPLSYLHFLSKTAVARG